jgi:hypothetical protein
MSLVLRCSVVNVEDSRIFGVKILTMECDKANIKMDIHKDLNPIEKGEKVNVGIYKFIPQYVKGVDFVAHGYVITKRVQDDIVKLYISLWGYLVIISTRYGDIVRDFNYMDKVYVKLWK